MPSKIQLPRCEQPCPFKDDDRVACGYVSSKKKVMAQFNYVCITKWEQGGEQA